MRVWRVCRKKHAADPLSGRGGLVASGRWHPKGIRIVYTSATLSLAALEILVQADKDLAPGDLAQVEIEIPDDFAVERVPIDKLPRNWRDYPAPPGLRKVGADWIRRGRSAVLQVPSAVIPTESNYLLNPAHAAASSFTVIGRSSFVLDTRLLS